MFSVSCQEDKDRQKEQPIIDISKQSAYITLPETDSGTANIAFSTNVSWHIITSDTRAVPSWFDVYPASGEAGTQLLTVSVREENTGYDDRNGYIKIVCGDTHAFITVTQKKKNALLITQGSYEVDMNGGEIEVEIKANVEFSVDIKNPEWIHLNQTRGLATSKLRFKVDAGEEADSREGRIVFSSDDITETVTVYQSVGEVLVLTQNEYVVPDAGTTIQVEIRTNTEYTVQMPQVDWIKESTNRAISAYTRYYEIAPNETYDSRTAHFIFSAADISEKVTVIQVQKDAIILAKSEYEFGLEGGVLSMEVQSNVGFDVTVSESANDWIKQINTRGLETTLLRFSVATQTDEMERIGTIVISKGDLKQTVTVKQSGASTTTMKAKEREALVAIYKATGGDNWANKTNWCSDKPVGEWYGVGVNNDGYVIDLSLYSNNLSGNIPAEIENLKELEVLRIADVLLPPETGNCINLKEIMVVCTPLPEEICNLTNLTSLDAVGISGTLPANLGNLKKLKHIRLDGSNGLTDVMPNSIGYLTDLEYLELNYCSLSGSIPTDIGRLTKLKTLMIVNCGITGTIPPEIGNCKQLEYIDLSQNKLSGHLPEQIGHIPGLRYLVLHNNRLYGEIPKSLQQNKMCWDRCWGFIIHGNDFELYNATMHALNFTVNDIDGNTIIAADEYAKNKYTVLLQFSPTFYSQTSAHELKRIYDTFKSKELDIIAYSFIGEGHGSSVELIREYVSKNNIPWRNIAWNENNPITDYRGDWPYHIYYPYHSLFITVVDSVGKIVFYAMSEEGMNDKLSKFLQYNLEATSGKVPINLSLEIESTTIDTSFEMYDKTGVYVVNYESEASPVLLTTNNYVDNLKHTYMHSRWMPEMQIYWKDRKTKADLYGFYPYAPVSDVNNHTFDLNADQSSPENYRRSKFLWGKTSGVSSTESAVNIKMKPLFSSIIIKIEPGEGYTAEELAQAQISVCLQQIRTTASVNLARGTVAPTGNAGKVVPLFVDGVYKAFVVPQIVSATNLITVTVNGKDYNLNKEVIFIANKQHTFTVKLKKTNSGMSVSIGSWETDDNDHGGVAI